MVPDQYLVESSPHHMHLPLDGGFQVERSHSPHFLQSSGLARGDLLVLRCKSIPSIPR